MNSFRYRTKTLLGPWRTNEDAAVQDAIRAKQARRDEEGEGWHWVVPGAIEEGHGQICQEPPAREKKAAPVFQVRERHRA